jgi:hypothetical protein
MSTSMKAAFTLTLEDKLSAGLDRIKKQFDELRGKGNQLTLGKLERGGDLLRTLTQEVRGLTSSLRTVSATADRAWASVKRMGSATANWGRNTFGKSSNIGAMQAAAAGYSVYGPLESVSELSNTLRHSAITAHQYGPDADRMMASQRALYTGTAINTAQGSHAIAEAGFWMALTGMSTQLVEKLVPLSAKIATAYNTQVGDAAKTAFGLNYSMGIGAPDMERALGMLALLGKHGHFLFADQAKSMPGITAAAQLSHMTGMGSLEEIGAAMQISMKVVDPAQPNMAATNLETFLRQIQQAREDKVFEKYGVDIDGVLMTAAGKGISPMEAILSKIRQIQDREAKAHHITDPGQRAQSDTAILNHLFRSSEAVTFASAMLHNLEEYQHLKEIAHDVTTDMIDKDFHEAMRDVNSQMKLFHEETTQLVDRLGSGFEPVLHLVNKGLLGLIHGMDWLDKKMPGLGNGVLAFGGGLLVVLAAIGAIGFVAPAVIAGFELIAGLVGVLLTPIGLMAGAIAALAVAGYEIYDNWDEVVPVLKEFGDAVGSVFYGAMDTIHDWMMNGLQAAGNAWDDMVTKVTSNDTVKAALGLLSTAWDGVKTAAQTAFNAMDGFEGGRISQVFGGIRDIVKEIADALKAIGDYFAPKDMTETLLNPTGGDGPGGSNLALGHTSVIDFIFHMPDGVTGKAGATPPGVRVTTAPNPGPTTNRH